MGLLMSSMQRARLGAVADYDAEIVEAAQRYGVDPDLIRSIMGVESDGNPDARGAAGEVGLMQVMPATARSVDPSVSTSDLWDPITNIDVGAHYLANQLARYGGDVAKAVSAYNAGTATSRNQPYVDKVFGAVWPAASDATGDPGPFDSTAPVAWVQDHPVLVLGLAVVTLWWLTGRAHA